MGALPSRKLFLDANEALKDGKGILDLSDHKLNSIPPAFVSYLYGFHLKELRLTGNNLTQLPQSFGRLQALE
jgi:hypothetical protein